MRKLVIKNGDKFGLLTVIEELPSIVSNNGTKRRKILCSCECGKHTTKSPSDLNRDRKISCGHIRSENITMLNKKRPFQPGYVCGNKTHGLRKSRTYNSYTNMMARCYNPKNHKYPRYGSIGIIVCDQWHTFIGFLNDMGESPGEGYSIERLNNSIGYNHDNCVWADAVTQANNKSNNIKIASEGKTLAQVTGGWKSNRYSMAKRRIYLGWCEQCAITIPARGGKCPHR